LGEFIELINKYDPSMKNELTQISQWVVSNFVENTIEEDNKPTYSP
jgi:hypothetical protein